MGVIFSWLSAPESVAQEDWSNFLDNYSIFFLIMLLLSVVGIVLGYRKSAKGLKVFRPEDVFCSYTPMRWLLLAVAGGIVAALVAAFQFNSALRTVDGIAGFASWTFALTAAISALVAYLLIVFVGGLTPAKFSYRPAPYRYKKGPAR